MSAWTPPDRVTVLTEVRKIVEREERWNQHVWFTSVFWHPCRDDAVTVDRDDAVTVDEVRPYAAMPMPLYPADRERPVCGSTGCVAGWIAVKMAPPGTVIDNGYLYFPGRMQSIAIFAADAIGLSDEQSNWLFSASRSREEVLAGIDALIENPDAFSPTTEDDYEDDYED